MTNPTNPPAGWYDDGSGRQRWWDGQRWGQFADEPNAPVGTVSESPAGVSGPYGPPSGGSAPKKAAAFALIALIVGIVAFLLGLVPVFGAIVGVVAVVFAVLALQKKQSKGMAITGLVLGGVAVLASIGMTAGLAGLTAKRVQTEAIPLPSASISQPAAAPTQTATPKTEPTASTVPEPEAPAVPAEYKSALQKAKTYSQMLHMSKAGLYDQLTSEFGEKFSPEAAQYAVDNVGADWNDNALAKAKTYQDQLSMSPEAIRDQLTSEYGEKFTPEEADYAIQHLNG